MEFTFTEEELNKIKAKMGKYRKLNMERVILKMKLLISLGFNQSQSLRIIQKFPEILDLDDNNTKEKFKNFFAIGYTTREILKLAFKQPMLLSLGFEKNIVQKISDLEELGFTRQDIVKISKIFPSIYTYNINTIRKRLDDFCSLGYSSEEVIKMMISSPTLFGLSKEHIEEKLNFLINLGFKKTQAIYVTSRATSLLTVSNETLQKRYDALISCDLTDEQLHQMIINYPSLLAFSPDNSVPKIKYYQAIELDSVIIREPKRLMQSFELSCARVAFFKELGHTITASNSSRIFINEKDFIKKYGITNDDLIAKYQNAIIRFRSEINASIR